MADESRLADMLVRHFPRDVMNRHGQEWRECECGFRFEESEEWALHAAIEILAAAPTEES